jgi:Zn-dependent peptidase ImmA (M78 family)/transcriptional regulator with XRE-family HTH domain
MMGDRIRQARLAAGLPLDGVVERLAEQGVSITKAGLSKYELNKSVPRAPFLLKLAGVLAVPSSYFLEEPRVTVAWIAFRKHARLGIKRQQQIKAYATAAAEGQVWLQSKLYPNEAPVFMGIRPAQSFDDAEAAAMELRQLWRLGEAPIESVTQSAETHDAVVVEWPGDGGHFDGLAGRINERIPLAVVSSRVPDDRRRFNLADELGHLILQPVGPMAEQEELLVHRFAGAFLAPASAARGELGTRRRHLSFQELGLLKRKYGLSIQAWTRRALDLEIIDEAHYNTMCREFSRRGWRKEEPVAFHGSEDPMRLQQLTFHALAEGVISEKQAARLCPGCTQRDGDPGLRPSQRRTTPAEMLALATDERERRLATATAVAEKDYRIGAALTDFEAFGEDDLYDRPDQG